jgi:hypothetical protein
VAPAAVHHNMHRMALINQQRDRVGELELAASAGDDPAQRVEHCAVQQVATGRREGGRRCLGRRLLHHPVHPFDLRVVGVVDVEHPVGGDLLARDIKSTQHAATVPLADRGHRDQHPGGQHEVVGQQDGHGVLGVRQ